MSAYGGCLLKQNITFLAVDLGTSFIKAGIYDTAGNCLVSAKEAVQDERPEPGVVIQRAEKLFASVVCCIQKTVKLLPEKVESCLVKKIKSQHLPRNIIEKTRSSI